MKAVKIKHSREEFSFAKSHGCLLQPWRKRVEQMAFFLFGEPKQKERGGLSPATPTAKDCVNNVQRSLGGATGNDLLPGDETMRIFFSKLALRKLPLPTVTNDIFWSLEDSGSRSGVFIRIRKTAYSGLSLPCVDVLGGFRINLTRSKVIPS